MSSIILFFIHQSLQRSTFHFISPPPLPLLCGVIDGVCWFIVAIERHFRNLHEAQTTWKSSYPVKPPGLKEKVEKTTDKCRAKCCWELKCFIVAISTQCSVCLGGRAVLTAQGDEFHLISHDPANWKAELLQRQRFSTVFILILWIVWVFVKHWLKWHRPL